MTFTYKECLRRLTRLEEERIGVRMLVRALHAGISLELDYQYKLYQDQRLTTGVCLMGVLGMILIAGTDCRFM